MTWNLQRGALPRTDGSVGFQVWAPQVKEIAVQCVSPVHSIVSMERHPDGLFTATVQGVSPGSRYVYILDGERTRPDPVSRFQPEGVHGPSEIVDPNTFPWTDQAWKGLALQDLIFYELHTGAFTPDGVFTAIIPYLDYLKNELGITAVELMPVAEFPGKRNWGYDGTHLYAPHASYGGPHGLKTLINACHENGLAVVLDVVYNHLGPEGNYLGEYGPYFTGRYQTPWGQAVNFDGENSSEVRRYFIDNALYWVTEYHVDGLRLDAVHSIFDDSPTHILQELGEAVHTQARALGRTILVLAESNLNDRRVISGMSAGGWGLDSQWSDDFHHSLHALLTKEQNGYYQDFGHLSHLATAITEGFVYQGQRSLFRKRPHGTSSRHLPGERFIVCNQNHDQVGNRAHGERLSTIVPLSALKLAAGLTLCAPNIPLLFMGEEYGETAPFLYFTSHTDEELGQAVREGRQQEFAEFAWEPAVPDPQDPQTFHRSILNHYLREQEPHRGLLRFYHDVIALRKCSPALQNCSKEHLDVTVSSDQQALMIHRWQPGEGAVLLFASFALIAVSLVPTLPSGVWRYILDSDDRQYEGAAQSRFPAVLQQNERPSILLSPFTFSAYCKDPAE